MACNDLNDRKASRCDREAGHVEKSHFDSRTGWQWTNPRPVSSGSGEAS